MALRWAHRLRNRWRRLVGMPLEGVSIILRNDAGEVLLVRHSYAGRRWTLPGGGVHRGEPPEQTARREMR
jgi:ADP-ribose pyrophosphatase YjhB (NUDIX family)